MVNMNFKKCNTLGLYSTPFSCIFKEGLGVLVEARVLLPSFPSSVCAFTAELVSLQVVVSMIEDKVDR